MGNCLIRPPSNNQRQGSQNSELQTQFYILPCPLLKNDTCQVKNYQPKNISSTHQPQTQKIQQSNKIVKSH